MFLSYFFYLILSWLIVVERFKSRVFSRNFYSVDGISRVFINWFILGFIEQLFKKKEKLSIV